MKERNCSVDSINGEMMWDLRCGNWRQTFMYFWFGSFLWWSRYFNSILISWNGNWKGKQIKTRFLFNGLQWNLWVSDWISARLIGETSINFNRVKWATQNFHSSTNTFRVNISYWTKRTEIYGSDAIISYLNYSLNWGDFKWIQSSEINPESQKFSRNFELIVMEGNVDLVFVSYGGSTKSSEMHG